jgi:predicted ATP-dependent serine protease
MPLTKRRVYIGDFYEEAQRLRGSFGKTTLFSTGHDVLDNYFGGGFGREDGYEIVLMYGETGIGKSTVALNFVAPAIRDGKKVGLLVLEDDMADVSNRLEKILAPSEYATMNSQQKVLALPDDALTKSWKLDDLLEYIEDWFTLDKCDLILLDHLQFAFENAEAVKGENEYIAQRVFMQKLNQLVKRLKKTIILISHVSKASQSKGMNKIAGSGALAQAATKVIEVSDTKLQDTIALELRKSRFTKRPGFEYHIKMVDARLEPNK